MAERIETLMRLVVGLVSGIIFAAWRYLIIVLMLFNFVYTLIMGKRLKEFANMCEIWNTQWYVFQRYLFFVSNDRPFPFKTLTKSMSKFGK
ncbi:MAG: DUF4389 domain-containing protein [Nanoarchaeota archaeon]|nr:DUF4389 domain-containing protein [Nanoarchaeota archaeon]